MPLSPFLKPKNDFGFGDDEPPQFEFAGVTDVLTRVRQALTGGRESRVRLAQLDDIERFLQQVESGSDEFAVAAALREGADAFASAEAKLANLQERVRGAASLDAQLLGERDDARRGLEQAAAGLAAIEVAGSYETVLRAGEKIASLIGTVAALAAPVQNGRNGRRQAPALLCTGVTLNGKPCQARTANPSGSCHLHQTDKEMSLTAWLAQARRRLADNAKRTDLAARELGAAMSTFVTSELEPTPSEMTMRLSNAALFGEREKMEADLVALPAQLRAKAVIVLEARRQVIGDTQRLLDRARKVRAVNPPSDVRFKVAQKRVFAAQKAMKHAQTDVDHPDDDADMSVLNDFLLQCKSEYASARVELNTAILELAALSFDFPELRLLYPSAKLDELFGAGGGDATTLRALDDYDERSTLTLGARNTIEKAKFNGEACALKLFRLDAKKHSAFMKEARRLRQLAHPHIVELRAVFVDAKASVGVLEMPLYAHCDVWHWLEADKRSIFETLALLRQVLCGLEHVHRMGVVHADVKPENVFVTGDGTGKLGDFDVSHDDVQRTTTLVGRSIQIEPFR
jgi:hypothetical protein